jgi:cytochrome b subunit of formate dehydrogenase
MTPIWLRLTVVGVGAAIFFGSWLVGNSVDSAEHPASQRYVLLQKDAVTFFMRIIGAMIAICGLLMWVAAGRSHSLL